MAKRSTFVVITLLIGGVIAALFSGVVDASSWAPRADEPVGFIAVIDPGNDAVVGTAAEIEVEPTAAPARSAAPVESVEPASPATTTRPAPVLASDATTPAALVTPEPTPDFGVTYEMAPPADAAGPDPATLTTASGDLFPEGVDADYSTDMIGLELDAPVEAAGDLLPAGSDADPASDMIAIELDEPLVAGSSNLFPEGVDADYSTDMIGIEVDELPEQG